jgi:hypothetical protein
MGRETLRVLLAIIALAPVTGASGPSSSADDPQARWTAFSRPGPEHHALARFVGEWETTTRVWLEPGGEPYAESRGTASHRWLEEGRWLALESSGTVMGIPHHGFGMLGYDNFKKKYVGSFVDNISTSILAMEGSWSTPDEPLVMFGTVDEPLTGEHDRAVEYAFAFTGADTLTLRVFDLPRGAENQVLELRFTRIR